MAGKTASKTVEAALKTAYATLAPRPDVVRQQDGAKTTFLVKDTPYASVELDGDTLRFRIRKPSDLTELEPMLHFYQESVEGNDTWLLFSMPANNKPGPALEANLGRFAGRTLRQVRMAHGG